MEIRHILSILLFLLVACSGISPLNTSYYSSEFLKSIESVNLIYKDGDKASAIRKLRSIPDENLNRDEQAKKYNLLGVMLYRNNDYERAAENFYKARQKVDRDPFLTNQIRLNLASLFYKQNQYQKSYDELKKIDLSYVEKKDLQGYHKLSFTLANQMEDSKRAVKSLLYLGKDIRAFADVENFPYKEVLIDNFKKLSDSERVYFLDDKASDSPFIIAYLGRMEAMNRLYRGDRTGAEDVVNWLDKKFNQLEEINTFVTDFRFRIDNFSKLNPKSIGLITSLSGKTSKWGRKALMGVNTALSKLTKKEDLYKIYIKDNQNNPYLSRNKVRELVEKHNVAVIIGGLFPNLAKEEYLEARKYGVLYVSLSQVYLPRSEKSHLLIEIPGSVESQVNSMLENPSFDTFGKKVAVLYPDKDEGYSYLNEFWKLHNSGKLELVNSNHYERGIKDYREPIKKLLGLKFPRERKEELLVWKEIKNIGKGSARIINYLPPVVDFDWVFIPSLPSEAIQIIPTFDYFDAKGVKFVGGPPWINSSLLKYNDSSGKRYVIGNDTKNVSEEFIKMYREVNETLPHLVDTLSYDAMKVSLDLLKRGGFASRDEFDSYLRETGLLKGVTSEWKLSEGLWFKEMDILRIQRDGFKKVVKEITPDTAQEKI